MTDDRREAMPMPVKLLGFAGLIPQIAAIAALLSPDPAWQFAAKALAFDYAALIFSFLGGMWWGLAARNRDAPSWTYALAVLPSLLALATAWPVATGGAWPEPSLLALGVLILVSPLVDLALGRADLTPPWWMRLRIPLSVGLGALTIVAGLLS